MEDRTEEFAIMELTYESRRFIFNRGLPIRVIQRELGRGTQAEIAWSYASNEIEVNGIGSSRSEAELSFQRQFVDYWDKISQTDVELPWPITELKRKFIELVKNVEQMKQ